MLQTILQKIPWILLIALLLLVWNSPRYSPVLASPEPSLEFLPVSSPSFPSLAQFRTDVQNGEAETLTGVYVSGILAAPIVQQPRGNAAYVSSDPESVTQFSLATSYDTIGLLAHNFLLGETFFNLQKGQKVVLVYGDGRVKYYTITKLERYQALSPTSPYSSFRSPENPGVTLSVEQMFRRIYGLGDRLVFQTCVEQNGNQSWGRLFVTAQPLEKNFSRDWFRIFSME